MREKKIIGLVFLIIFAMNTCAWAQLIGNKKDMARKKDPIEIVSDRMEAFQAKRMIVFSGKTVATQGEVKIKTDRLSIYYKNPEGKQEKIGKQDMAVSGDLDRIELKGNVVITQKDISATGDEAVYYQDDAKVIMTGNPVLKQGKNVIKGCRVVIFIDESRGKVEQCESGNTGRVSAVIHPQEKK